MKFWKKLRKTSSETRQSGFEAMGTKEVLCGVIGTPEEYNLGLIGLIVLLSSNKNRIILLSVQLAK